MFTTLIRTAIMYFFVVLTIRMMGKRQIGELEPSELVVTIVISEVAALPIQDSSQPLINSLIAIFLLLILEVLLSFGAYKSFTARRIFFGTPSIFYEKGVINQREMQKHRFNLHDLMECVRNTGAASLAEVDYVIMETNGNVSVIPKTEYRPVNVSDAGLCAPEAQISYIIVDNGKLNSSNLRKLGFNLRWLQKQLAAKNISNISDVFCMTVDKSGEAVIVKIQKEKKSK